MADLERELDRLYGLPLDEFTAARNELARGLKGEGEAEAAARVRELAKPSVPAWAINQLGRRHRDLVDDLLAAGAAVRAAQQRLLGGAGDADALRDATAKQRDAVQRLLREARSLLAEAGRPATTATLDQVARTLQAGAVEEEGRRLIAAGRLVTALEPAGFEALPAPAGGPRRPPRNDAAAQKRQADERRRQRRELQQRAQALERVAKAAEREAERAAAAAAEAREAAERARAEADDAAAELERAANAPFGGLPRCLPGRG